MTNEITVESLRNQGYRVRVKHFRWVFNEAGMGWLINPKDAAEGETIDCKGGTTVVEIRTPEGKEIVGEAKCSDKDDYNKRLGRHIAIKRALASV